MNEKISFIVPVFNGEAWIDRCLTSLQRQTYPHFEAIVVDDGSTDSSLKRCVAFAEADARFHVYSLTHCGLSDTRNFGLSRATGACFGFLDSDDWVEKEFSERLLSALLSKEAEIASCRSVPATDETKRAETGGFVPVRQYAPSDYLALEYQDPDVNVRVGNRLYIRRLFERVRFPSGELYEDVITNYLLCRQCTAVAHLDAPLHNYYIGNESITRCPLKQKDLDLPRQWARVSAMIKNDFPELFPLAKAMQITALRTLADKYLRYGGDTDTAKALVRAFRRSFPQIAASKAIPWDKKARSFAAMIGIPLYGRVTEIIRHMGN